MPKDYGSWSLADLKAELRKRNAKLTGRKAALVQRLIDYDLMFGQLVNDPEASYHISLPEPDLFLDINSNSTLPNISEADIAQYSILGERENLITSKNMYDEAYLLSSRVAQINNFYYVSAVCAAEMRKNIVYNIAIKLEDNIISEAQCECTAGMGPYSQCKHVLVLMYGLIDFSKNKIIKTRGSSTSTLQTFHQPARMYTGEPVLAQNLKLKKNNENLEKMTTFDPHVNVTSKEKYREVFRNLTLNFAANEKTNMPVQQLWMPANKLALYQDHDYFEKTMEDRYIEDLKLSEEQITELEIETSISKKKWKNERQLRLQSSNFGRICKCTSTSQVKLAKTFLKDNVILTPAIKHGLKYEKMAIRKLSTAVGKNIKKCGIFVNKERQFLASTPDGIIKNEAVVEVKCPYIARNKMISAETIPYLYLCEQSGTWRLEKNHDYYYQVQGQMLCTGIDLCYFGIYTIADFYYIQIERDDMFIKDIITKIN